MKNVLPWVLSIAFAGVIIYLLFRPVNAPDNSAELKKIDSLKTIVNRKTDSLNILYARIIPRNDSLKNASDSMVDVSNTFEKLLKSSEYDKLQMAKQILLLSQKEPIDTICVDLAAQVIKDSDLIQRYEQNTNRLVFGFNQSIMDLDSLVAMQKSVIYSDSVLIYSQGKLIDVQQGQIKKLVRHGKTVAWIGRSLALTTAILAAVLLSK